MVPPCYTGLSPGLPIVYAPLRLRIKPFSDTMSERDETMSIQQQLTADRVAAMKSGDKATVNVVRQIDTEVAVAKSAPGFAGEVDDDLYRATIASYVKKMDKARTEYASLGERGEEQAEALGFEIEYLSRFLPDSLSEEDTRALVQQTISELGVDDPKMKGRVIGAVMQSGAELDGALVARLVGEELSD